MLKLQNAALKKRVGPRDDILRYLLATQYDAREIIAPIDGNGNGNKGAGKMEAGVKLVPKLCIDCHPGGENGYK